MDSVQTFSSTTSILESYSQPVALSTSANLLKPDEQHQITAPFVDNSCSSQLLDPNHKFPSDTPTSFHHLAKKSFLDNPCYESPPSNSKNSLLNGVKTRKRNNHSTQSDRQYKDFQPYIGRDSEDFSYLPSTAKNSESVCENIFFTVYSSFSSITYVLKAFKTPEKGLKMCLLVCLYLHIGLVRPRLVMSMGQNFLTRVGSIFCGSGRVRLGQPFMVWVRIWKISPKNVKFFIFSPSDLKRLLWVGSEKTRGHSRVGLLFTADQK